MRELILGTIVLLMTIGSGFAEQSKTEANPISVLKLERSCDVSSHQHIFDILKSKNAECLPSSPNYIEARRGCCSHHGGVCGCSHGRNLCCDGELSPSCGC